MYDTSGIKLNRIYFSRVEYDFTHQHTMNKVHIGITLQAQVSEKEKITFLVFKYVMSENETAKSLVAIDCTLEYEGRIVRDSGKPVDPSIVSEAYDLFKARLIEFSNAVKITSLPIPDAVSPVQYQI